ncbi:MAG TPA: hypothetical protein PL045_02740 [Chitinophagaceae bacterium]|nr:hypothetical protein [Chitinophagaceae bacterium]
MEYIVVLDPDTKAHAVIETSHHFLEKFASYQAAKQEAEFWKNSGDCKSYSIYALCSDSRNHVV